MAGRMSATMKIEAVLKFPDPQEIFTHVDITDGKARTFLIETMRHFAKDYPACAELVYAEAPVTKHLADYLRANAGIEPVRVKRLREPYLSEPLLGILWPDGETTIIDGNHRIVRMQRQGKISAKIIMFKYPFWENFLLPDSISDQLVKDGCLTNDSNMTRKIING